MDDDVKPLAGVRVIDFGRYIAGPFAAAMLADFGADVIRVERREGGEDRFIYPVTPQGDGALFLQMNRNKRGLTLDMKAADAPAILRRLVQGADVVMANLPGPTLRELRLDYESLRAIRPDVILAATSAFGPDGPYADKVGFDGIGQAMLGAAYLSGEGERPIRSYASWVDFTTALMSAYGVMAALMVRQRTGRGQEVRANLFASAATVMNFALIEQALVGADRTRIGNRGQSGAPSDFFPTRDGWIAVLTVGGAQFRRWARLVGEPGWIDDPRFATDASRAEHGPLLSERTAAWSAGLTTADALAALEAAKLPAGPVLSPAQALEDAHLKATGLLAPMEHPGAPGPVPIVASPVTLSAAGAGLRRRAPLVGEHTDEVLGELGFSAAEIAGFREAGAV